MQFLTFHISCRGNDKDPPECDPQLREEVESNEYCGLLQDMSASKPFRACINDLKSNAVNLMENCVYDVCANQNGDMKNAACKSLAVFATSCEDLGHIVDWRVTADCGKCIAIAA